MESEDVCSKIVRNIFFQFDSSCNENLSKFQFVSSLNHLSKQVGGHICPRSDLDCIFQLIDENGDQKISKN